MFENLSSDQKFILIRAVYARRATLNVKGAALIKRYGTNYPNNDLGYLFYECLQLKELGEELCEGLDVSDKFKKGFAQFTPGERICREVLDKQIS